MFENFPSMNPVFHLLCRKVEILRREIRKRAAELFGLQSRIENHATEQDAIDKNHEEEVAKLKREFRDRLRRLKAQKQKHSAELKKRTEILAAELYGDKETEEFTIK